LIENEERDATFFRLAARSIEYPTKLQKCGVSGAFSGVKPPNAPSEALKRPSKRAMWAPRGVIPQFGLASIGFMSTTVSALPCRETWLTRVLRRDLFRGTGYAMLVTLILMVGWDLEGIVVACMKNGIATTLMRRGTFFLFMMHHQLPMVPVLAVAINLAPASGAKRYLCFGLVGVAMWGFCTALYYLSGEGTANLEYAAMVALIVTTCVYRSSARSAAEAFMQRQIEGAALDADVKRARLQLLRAQIEPHFLFNTLATVRTLARADRAAAVDMIDHLMRYLSEALPKLRQEQCFLSEERELIDAYLRIHQIRMGSRLSYELLIPEAVQDQRIPTMILLTLVENAVKHGINPAVDGGRITVSANRERDALILKVSDSGQGMAATDGHGMGLANIRRRLMMLYGDSAVLSLGRPASRGVTATVSIPLTAA